MKLPPKKAPQAEPHPKKPYEKPRFKYERVFETAALSCGKNEILPLQCTINIKTS